MILVDWYDPGYKAGGQIRSIKNMVATLENDFDIYIVTSDNDMGDVSLYSDVEKNIFIKKNAHHIIYLTTEKLTIHNLKELIKEVKPDLLYLNSMFSLNFTIKPLLGLKNNDKIKIILSPRGMLQDGAMQFKFLKKRLFIWCMKIIGIEKKITFHATDDNEKNDIIKYFGKGITLRKTPDFFASDQHPLKNIEKKSGMLNVLFVSRITAKKNLHFALKAMLDTEPHTQIQFTIVGPVESDDYWRKCKKIMDQMPSHVHVHYAGSIHPSVLHEYYNTSHIFFLPTYGENFGHVIFDAFLYGRPVLISDQTPWKNLQLKQCGLDIALDHPSLYSNFINAAAQWNQQEFDGYCSNAWNYAHEILENTDLKSIYKELFSHG